MFGIGMSEMLVICGVALLVFGPNELPQIAKKIARGVRDIRRASDDLRRSIDLDDDDTPPRPTPPPAITGSALTASSGSSLADPSADGADDSHDSYGGYGGNDGGASDDNVLAGDVAPAIVPAAAVAVGSVDVNDGDASDGEGSAADATDDAAAREPARG